MASFAAGLLLGQLSVIIVAAMLLRFFLFAESPPVHQKSARKPTPTPVSPQVLPTEPADLATILEHIYYDLDSHSPESMDWFTFLIALQINAFRKDAIANDNMLNFLKKMFSNEKIPQFIDKINITELDLGKDYPLFHNCKVIRTDDIGFSDGLEVQFDIDLKDKITLGVETQVALNYPKMMVAYLPIKASVSLVNFSGKLSIAMLSEENESFITVKFSEESAMQFEVQSIIGARAQLENVPKIGQLVESIISRKFSEALVHPNFLKVKIPSVWKAKQD